VRESYFYDARSDFIDLDKWMAPRLGGLVRFQLSFVKQRQQVYMYLAQPIFALSCMLWEAMDVSKATRRFAMSAAQQAPRYDVDFSCRMA
jgi:hypothetical protein